MAVLLRPPDVLLLLAQDREGSAVHLEHAGRHLSPALAGWNPIDHKSRHERMELRTDCTKDIRQLRLPKVVPDWDEAVDTERAIG